MVAVRMANHIAVQRMRGCMHIKIRSSWNITAIIPVRSSGQSGCKLSLSSKHCIMLRRALPPIAALFSLVHAIQHFLQPYQERYQAASDALRGWWRVRAERCSFTARLMCLMSLHASRPCPDAG